jgi:hypothetical protein
MNKTMLSPCADCATSKPHLRRQFKKVGQLFPQGHGVARLHKDVDREEIFRCDDALRGKAQQEGLVKGNVGQDRQGQRVVSASSVRAHTWCHLQHR